MKQIAMATCCVAALLVGCSQDTSSPGQQCLSSFRLSLTDPDSGKVISFEPIAGGVQANLVYTATNSFGARVQDRTICRKTESGSWARDENKIEYERARSELQNHSDQMGKRIACLQKAIEDRRGPEVCP